MVATGSAHIDRVIISHKAKVSSTVEQHENVQQGDFAPIYQLRLHVDAEQHPTAAGSFYTAVGCSQPAVVCRMTALFYT